MTAIAVSFVVDGPSDGAVVVLSGSLGSDVRMWGPQVKPLVAAGFRVVRYDHRGHGKSPVPPGPYDLADLGADAIALADTLSAKRMHWVGLSLGGMVGTWLGQHAPDRIASLTLMCTSAQLGPPQMWRDRAEQVRAGGAAAVADAAMERWFTADFRATHENEVAGWRAMVADTPAEGYAACCAAIERMDLVGGLSSITVPTLAIAGAQDPTTPPDHLRRLADGMPSAHLEVLDPGAHLLNVERSDAVTRLIIEHVRDMR